MITSDAGFVIATPTKCGTTTLEEMCRRHRGGRGGVPRDNFRIMDWELPRRQHRMALPATCPPIRHKDAPSERAVNWRDADRYLMVRNPYTRYMSMYEYLRAPHNYSKFGAREIQGREWRGLAMGKSSHCANKAPMTFRQFLHFIAAERKIYASGRWAGRRGDLTDPFAYRSPWVWLDSLTDSLALLRAQPGGAHGTVNLLRVEHFWLAMEGLKDRYDLGDLSVRPTIRANKTLTYRPGGGIAYWGEIAECAHGVFGYHSGDGFRPEAVRSEVGCDCAACDVGVADEARALGYA